MSFRRVIERAATVCTLTVLGACASGYSQFYKPAQNIPPEQVALLREAPAPAQPRVERAPPPAQDAQPLLDTYLKRGYVLIGSSQFNSGRNESEEAAVAHGKTVGADLVLILNPRYTGSTTTAVPLTLPTSTTSYSTGTATAYGPGGAVSAYGTGTTTTHGTTTTMVPMTTHRTDFGAGYFVKIKTRFGVVWRELTDAERQELQSNKGAPVRLVVNNSPAFAADILPGDIILAVDDEPVASPLDVNKKFDLRAGKVVKLSLYRRGVKLDKTLQLANP